MTSTWTYTNTRTRTEAVLDQFSIFLLYSGLPAAHHEGILKGVENRWLEAVGVFLQDQGGHRILEAEVTIDWKLHSDLCVLSPVVRTDLPGWSKGASPEIQTIGNRFGKRAQQLGVTPRAWVSFIPTVRADPARHRQLCEEVGVTFGSSLPAWKSEPQKRSYSIEDLREVGVTLLEA